MAKAYIRKDTATTTLRTGGNGIEVWVITGDSYTGITGGRWVATMNHDDLIKLVSNTSRKGVPREVTQSLTGTLAKDVRELIGLARGRAVTPPEAFSLTEASRQLIEAATPQPAPVRAPASTEYLRWLEGQIAETQKAIEAYEVRLDAFNDARTQFIALQQEA